MDFPTAQAGKRGGSRGKQPQEPQLLSTTSANSCWVFIFLMTCANARGRENPSQPESHRGVCVRVVISLSFPKKGSSFVRGAVGHSILRLQQVCLVEQQRVPTVALNASSASSPLQRRTELRRAGGERGCAAPDVPLKTQHPPRAAGKSASHSKPGLKLSLKYRFPQENSSAETASPRQLVVLRPCCEASRKLLLLGKACCKSFEKEKLI